MIVVVIKLKRKSAEFMCLDIDLKSWATFPNSLHLWLPEKQTTTKLYSHFCWAHARKWAESASEATSWEWLRVNKLKLLVVINLYQMCLNKLHVIIIMWSKFWQISHVLWQLKSADTCNTKVLSQNTGLGRGELKKQQMSSVQFRSYFFCNE